MQNINRHLSVYDKVSDGRYNELPRLSKEPHEKIVRVLRRIVGLTVIIPFVALVINLFSESRVRRKGAKIEKKMAPLAKIEVKNLEKRIQKLAKKIGLTHPNRFRVSVFPDSIMPAATGSHTLIFPSCCLVNPKDLPSNLHIDRIEKGELSEEEWVGIFVTWLNSSYIPRESKFKSQLEVDVTIAYAKLWLEFFRDKKLYKKVFKSTIGHEFKHCKTKDSIKIIWTRFALQLLSTLTLGLSLFFDQHIMKKLSLKNEKNADLFSKEKVKKGKEGLVIFFSKVQEINKILHKKYPEYYDHNGNNKEDTIHPKLTKRLAYLSSKA